MSNELTHLKAIVFDWAGTMVDYGCRAPAIVFQAIFKQRGIEITQAQAREPMGRAKRDHIAAITAMPTVAKAWTEKYGQPCTDADVDAMYADFLPLQKKTLADHCDLIPGAADTAAKCRELGLKIGSSTGYTHELMEVVSAAAKPQGYEPDCVLCAEDAPQGRPAPYLLHEAAKRMNVFPMWSFVKVDDTPVGIEAGRNAGCWTVGITRSGNCVGLSLEEANQLPEAELKKLCDHAADQLTSAGAHYIIESVAEIPALLLEIEKRSASGELPISR